MTRKLRNRGFRRFLNGPSGKPRQKQIAGRKLCVESLENRVLLAADFAQNPVYPEDVNVDGVVSPLDALVVINCINQPTADCGSTTERVFVDVNGDRLLSRMDALLVIDQIESDSEESGAPVEARIARLRESIESDNLPRHLDADQAFEVLATLENGGRPELGDRFDGNGDETDGETDSGHEEDAALLSYHEGYWVGQTTIPGSPAPATFVNDIHVDTETGYVTVYAQTRVGNTIVSPVQVGPGETGVLPDGSTLAAHPNAVYLNGSGQELMEADGTGTWWVKHPVIAEEGYYNVEVEAAEYVEVYVEGELQEDGSIRVGGIEQNSGAEGFNTRLVNTDTDPDTYTITRYRPANLDPSAGPIDLTPVPDPAGTFTMQRSAGVSPFDGTVYRGTEDPASSTRGQHYTELIAVTVNPATGSVTTEVWGTQGTDTSPEAAALIDLEAAAQQLNATRVILNGPRYLLADAGTLTPGEAPIQTFGDLEMQLIGSIELDLASAPTSLESDPYVPQTVSRNTDSIYYAGSEIYQLTSPAGEMYVMQSTGTEIENADLAGLGDRLTLPEGWVFEVITLEEPLRVTVSDGDTIDVLVDDLRNAYGYVGIDPLRYHDGYFVGDANIPGFPPGAKAHQDVYVDYETERVTIYAQTRVGDQIFAPPQIGPGETTTLPNGQPVSFHPDAVYLNGSGQELMESDGTGQWWVKHSWVNGGEGYYNTPVFPAAEYPELYVEGDYFQGGPTIRIGGTTPETESYYNLREPLVGGDPNAFRWSRYEPANDDPTVGPIDLTPTERFSFDLYRTEAVSAFDGSQRTPIGGSSDPTPVSALTASPDPSPNGSNITLTATPVVTAAQVVFFRESNGTAGLQNTDTLVGTDTNGADGWTASVNVGTTPGTFTYYAVPVNANGPVGAPMVTTNTVQGGVETAIPNEPADQVYTTADGVEFVRTPDEQFENLPDWPYEPKYVEIDGLRQAYIDEGPEDGPVVLLLHGQPSWSYLYRDMIPVLVDAGYRVIAMDHLGMGRSDKPTDVDYYTYEVHTDRLEQFIGELALEDINLFAQDWGSLVGLHVAGENPEWFASIAIGNGTLPVIPAGTEPFPPVLNTDAIVDVPSPFDLMPAQQVPFRDADGELLGQGPAGAFGDAYFGNWMNFAMTGASFQPSDVLEALTWFDIPADEQAAYDAPFPSRAYMAGPRSFPSVINDLAGANDQAWAGLGTYDKPFVTIWGGNDPGNLGGSEVQQQLIDHVPGADGQPHTRLPEASHFLQDDQGEEIATQLVAFYQANGIEGVGNDDGSDNGATILTTEAGVEFVRTPDEQFESLPDWPYEPKYVEIDGLRQAYIDEGPADGPVVLLLHGQPSWSYLYRDMIPVLADAGYRVIAMDHLGMGRSDKPIDIESYSFLNHTYRLEQFIQELGLEDINLFAQDWGSIIGLHVAGLNPDWFATISIGNGSLPMFPAGAQPFPDVEDPDAILPLPSPFALFPDQQVPFYDAEGNLLLERQDNSYFGRWINYAMTGESFHASEVLEALTWFPLTAEEEAAYDAPFPSRVYMAGTRAFPSLVNDLPGVNQASFAGLQSYENPFLTIWGANDPGAAGSLEAQQFLINSVPGAQGQPHTRLPEASHFLQDDQGEEIATQLVAFYQANGIEGVDTVEEDPTRYIDSIFETTISDDIVYATVDGQELLLNVITPQGDTETDRPLILIANGGAFAFTDREQIIPVAEHFAEAGYVAAVMSYRTQGGPTSGEDFRYAALDATHDMIGAVRFMKANAEAFGIDPNKVIVGGASAGAVMAAAVGTTDPDDPMSDELAAYLETVGGVYGNVGEHLDQSPAVQGVFAISGAIFGLDTIDANSAPIYAVHNELDPVAPCGSIGGSGSGIPASGTCDFIPAFQAAGVPAQSFIVPGDTGHVQFSQEEWQQFTAEALEFFFAHVVNDSGKNEPSTDEEILSAYLGAVDIPVPRALEAITGAEQQVGDDGMRVVFSVQIDASTLSPEDFEITTASGATTKPTVATLAPADESDELRTVLLAGPLGSSDDLPVSITVVGSLQSLNGDELRGLTSEVSTNENGPDLVLALLDPAGIDANGDETTPARVQTTWQGGVSGRFGRELGLRELRGIRLIDENGDAHRPVGFEDLGDEDNHVVLLVPEGVTPVRVEVRAGTLYDPTNQPNPDTSIEIVSTADLEEEIDDCTFRDLIRDRVESRFLPARNVLERLGNVVGNAARIRHAITHLKEAADHEHDRPGLLRGRGLRGPRVAMATPTNQIPSLVPSIVDAVLQSDVIEDSTDSLLSRMVSELPANRLRGIGRRFR